MVNGLNRHRLFEISVLGALRFHTLRHLFIGKLDPLVVKENFLEREEKRFPYTRVDLVHGKSCISFECEASGKTYYSKDTREFFSKCKS